MVLLSTTNLVAARLLRPLRTVLSPALKISTMTVTTVTSDPRRDVRKPVHQQAFSTSATDADQSRNRPKVDNASEDAPVYVLTLLTDNAHHESMNQLRQAYFPPKLNKLEAHITLFHALPEEKLEQDILPAIRQITSRTSPYRIEARDAFRLKKGVGIRVADDIDFADKGKDGRGRNMTRIIHAELRKAWSTWLSDQDSQSPRLHYTVANKINDNDVVDRNLKEVTSILDQAKSFHSAVNTNNAPQQQQSTEHATENPPKVDGRKLKLLGGVHGLTLWKYMESGHWAEPRNFRFTGRSQR